MHQVSKSWRVLAEDEVLWYRLFIQEGYHRVASVSDSPCWKSTLRDCFNTEKTVKYNWKVSRRSRCSELEEELDFITNTGFGFLFFSASYRIESGPSAICSMNREKCCVMSVPVTDWSWLGECLSSRRLKPFPFSKLPAQRQQNTEPRYSRHRNPTVS